MFIFQWSNQKLVSLFWKSFNLFSLPKTSLIGLHLFSSSFVSNHRLCCAKECIILLESIFSIAWRSSTIQSINRKRSSKSIIIVYHRWFSDNWQDIFSGEFSFLRLQLEMENDSFTKKIFMKDILCGKSFYYHIFCTLHSWSVMLYAIFLSYSQWHKS